MQLLLKAKLTTPSSSLVNAKNKVPEHQRVYQAAYRAHTRIWKIVSQNQTQVSSTGWD